METHHGLNRFEFYLRLTISAQQCDIFHSLRVTLCLTQTQNICMTVQEESYYDQEGASNAQLLV